MMKWRVPHKCFGHHIHSSIYCWAYCYDCGEGWCHCASGDYHCCCQKTYKNESIELSDRTITQNLAAIALKTPLENSGRLFNELGAFLKECLLSYKLESKLKSKDKILEIYFNNALFGENITGILQASSIYFNKRPAELSENECVTLTAILKTPGKLQSKNSVETLKSAKQSIIKKMTASKLIDENKGRELESMRTKMYIPAEIEL